MSINVLVRRTMEACGGLFWGLWKELILSSYALSGGLGKFARRYFFEEDRPPAPRGELRFLPDELNYWDGPWAKSEEVETEPIMPSSLFNETKARLLGEMFSTQQDEEEHPINRTRRALGYPPLPPSYLDRLSEVGPAEAYQTVIMSPDKRERFLKGRWLIHLAACGSEFRGCAPGCPKDEAQAQEEGRASIRCKTCGMRSYRPEDVRQKFCASCGGYHQSPESYEITEGGSP